MLKWNGSNTEYNGFLIEFEGGEGGYIARFSKDDKLQKILHTYTFDLEEAKMCVEGCLSIDG